MKQRGLSKFPFTLAYKNKNKKFNKDGLSLQKTKTKNLIKVGG